MSPTRRTRIALVLASFLAGISVVAACGAASDNKTMAGDTDSAGSAPASASEFRDATSADGASLEAPVAATGDDAVKRTSASVVKRAVISTGSLIVETKKLADVRHQALTLVDGLRGTVDDEQSSSDSRGRLEHVELTLRVPSESFEKALDGLAGLGTLRDREQSSKDVTTEVIDNDARVKAQAASVASIERLLARATTIGEIMSIENQLTRRQAELDSLKQQQKYLADQTSMSTIRLSLARTEKKADEDHGGFIGGLEDGWNALGDSTVAIGTGLGAVLPFAVVLALIGVPAWLLVRRFRAARSVAVETPAEV